MNEESMLTDKQYTGMLIDEFQRLERILKAAENESAVETVKLINDEIKYLRLKLEPVKLPQRKSKNFLEIASTFGLWDAISFTIIIIYPYLPVQSLLHQTPG